MYLQEIAIIGQKNLWFFTVTYQIGDKTQEIQTYAENYNDYQNTHEPTKRVRKKLQFQANNINNTIHILCSQLGVGASPAFVLKFEWKLH